MSRLDENKVVMVEMYKLMNNAPTNTCEEKNTLQLAVIATMLTDISKSLAILADKADKPESEDK